MLKKMTLRVVCALAAGAAAALPPPAIAQEWQVRTGGAARAEFNDNYFFTPTDTQSGFTASIIPFVTAARRTETTEVAALVAVGANKVWGLSSNVDYLSGRFGLEGSVREVDSTWTGSASFVRSPTLQNESGQVGAPLVLAFTNAANVGGGYSYKYTERSTLGATIGAYSNRYDSVGDDAALSNNHGYYAGGSIGYTYSDNTQFTFNALYSDDTSNITDSNAVTTTIGVVHRFSPQLTVSISGGGYWSDTTAEQSALVCPAAQELCDTGVVQPVSILAGDRRRASGGLYGGSMSYAFSERMQLYVGLAETLAPNASGLLSKSDNAVASLSYQFSDRLTGRLGASYTRTVFLAVETSSYNNNYYQGEVGLSYRLAERWTLDAGYRYATARYSQNSFEPRSNVAFVSLGYNWPGASFTGWVGTPPVTQGLPGAGPLSLPESSRAQPGTSAAPETSPFDPFTLP
jgi:long-subunit fatty acid transport protein